MCYLLTLGFLLYGGGGMGRCATATYKRLAALLATKRDEAYPVMMG